MPSHGHILRGPPSPQALSPVHTQSRQTKWPRSQIRPPARSLLRSHTEHNRLNIHSLRRGAGGESFKKSEAGSLRGCVPVVVCAAELPGVCGCRRGALWRPSWRSRAQATAARESRLTSRGDGFSETGELREDRHIAGPEYPGTQGSEAIYVPWPASCCPGGFPQSMDDRSLLVDRESPSDTFTTTTA